MFDQISPPTPPPASPADPGKQSLSPVNLPSNGELAESLQRLIAETGNIALLPALSMFPLFLSPALSLESITLNASSPNQQMTLPCKRKKQSARPIAAAKSDLPQPKKAKMTDELVLNPFPLSWSGSQNTPCKNTPAFAPPSPNLPWQDSANLQDGEGNTALMSAILHKNITKACSLITPFVNLNLQNNEGDTALILAIKLKYINIARDLIYQPAVNIFLLNEQKRNAFAYLDNLSFGFDSFLFIREIHTLRAQQISQHFINSQWEGTTLLCSAVSKKSLSALQILLQRGANPDIPDNHGNTPLMLAIKQGCIAEIIELLPTTRNFDQQDQAGDTALTLAIHLGYLQIARALIQHPVNIFLLNKRRENAFFLLFQQGYHQTYQHHLLARNMIIASIHRYPFIFNHKVDGNNTLLAVAAKLGELAILQKLIAKGADPNIPDLEGNTPLMLAVKQGYLFESNLLKTVSSNINQQNQEGDTALMLAIRLGYFQIASMLTASSSHQVDIFLTNQRGESAFSLLFAHKVTFPVQKFIIATDMLLGTLYSLPLEKIDCKVEGSNTLLCLAVMLNNMSIIKQLLNKGANLNIPNDEGDTPLMLAIKQKQLELTHFLFSLGPDLTSQNQQGESAYMLVLKNDWDLQLFNRQDFTP